LSCLFLALDIIEDYKVRKTGSDDFREIGADAICKGEAGFRSLDSAVPDQSGRPLRRGYRHRHDAQGAAYEIPEHHGAGHNGRISVPSNASLRKCVGWISPTAGWSECWRSGVRPLPATTSTIRAGASPPQRFCAWWTPCGTRDDWLSRSRATSRSPSHQLRGHGQDDN
jgi:hypothetical protein